MKRAGGANGHAGATVDATFGIDVELGCGFELGFVLFRMDTVGGAHIHAERILDAGVGNDVGHDENPFWMNWSLATPVQIEGRSWRAGGVVMVVTERREV